MEGKGRDKVENRNRRPRNLERADPPQDSNTSVAIGDTREREGQQIDTRERTGESPGHRSTPPPLALILYVYASNVAADVAWVEVACEEALEILLVGEDCLSEGSVPLLDKVYSSALCGLDKQ
jgi:hypothetical protein